MQPQWVRRPPTTSRRPGSPTSPPSCTARTGEEYADYQALWRWSVDDLDGFWRRSGTISNSARPTGEVLGRRGDAGRAVVSRRPAQLRRPGHAACAQFGPPGDRSPCGEDGRAEEVSWPELIAQVRVARAHLREQGVGPGDRVVGYLPNIPEAIVAFLATASIGAVWSACGQDYSAKAALDRLGQLEPTVLVTADGYRFGGKEHDRSGPTSRTCAMGCPRLRATVVVTQLGLDRSSGHAVLGGRDRRRRTRRDSRPSLSIRPPAVGGVLLRHHRVAQGHRPRPRRRAARAPESRRAATRTSAPRTRSSGTPARAG